MKKTLIVCYAEGYCDQVAYALQEYYSKKADEVSLLFVFMGFSFYTHPGVSKL